MPLRSFAIGVGVTLALSFVAGCSDQSANINQLNQNEFALRGMIASDRQQIDALKADLRRTQDEIAEIRHEGAATPGAAAAPGDVNDRLSRLESEVGAMQAALPTVPAVPGIPTAAAPPGPATSETTTATASSPTTPPLPVPPVAAPPSPTVTNAPTEPAPTWPQDLDKELASADTAKDSGAKIYRKGLDAMKAGNYPAAIVNFAKVEHSYAKSPLSEPAQYFTANAFYESGKFEQAILQFNDLVMRFPSSRFTCQSLLREGQAFVQLNDKIDARLTLQKLTGNSACTNESVVANNMLKSLATD